MSAVDVLVVGARHGSLGRAVANLSLAVGMSVATAGITTEEQYRCDVRVDEDVADLVTTVLPRHVVCTVGINRGCGVEQGALPVIAEDVWRVNVAGPIRLLGAWLRNTVVRNDATQHFVAVSSNSAHIARRNSLAYCSSKAALSMAMRVAAREVAGRGVAVWCVEPGVFEGPMTSELKREWLRDGPLHRIPGLPPRSTLSSSNLAVHIVRGLQYGGAEMNGACLRLDGGEQ